MSWWEGFLLVLASLVSPIAVFVVLCLAAAVLVMLSLALFLDRLTYPGHWGYRGEPWWHKWWWPMVGLAAWVLLALPALIAIGSSYPDGLPVYWG